MSLDHLPFSYRSDPSVPKFDDAAPVAFMDGECTLCSFGARMIHRLDRTGTVRICPIQTELGRAYHGFDAMIQMGKRTGGLGHGLRLIGLVPRQLRDWMYIRIARNRYALFGRNEMCALPDPQFRARLIE